MKVNIQHIEIHRMQLELSFRGVCIALKTDIRKHKTLQNRDLSFHPKKGEQKTSMLN